jgi:hypothetical protein
MRELPIRTLLLLLALAACRDDGGGDQGVFCCALQELCSRRSNCPPEFATAPCTASEKSIAAAGNEQVCQQLLSSEEFGVLGCNGTRSFQESDALAACTQ